MVSGGAAAVFVLILAVGLGATLLTGRIRRYALAREVLDRPTARSSHTVPMPRGGGLAMVATFTPAALVLAWGGWIPSALAMALLGGLAVAWVGWLDDHRPLPALHQEPVQGAAALWALWWLEAPEGLRAGAWTLPLGWAAPLLAGIALVWLTNLYNFMDGIDGLAAAEAVTVALGVAFLLALSGRHGMAVLLVCLAAAAFGFLAWNLPPARIFMGDVGSAWLGYTFGVLALASEGSGGPPLLLWLLLLGVFVVDATCTLLKRIVAGEPWHRPHRSHAYQLLARSGWGHGGVTGAVAAVNLLVLLPAAAWAQAHPRYLPAVTGLGLLALVAAWAWIQVSRRGAGP